MRENGTWTARVGHETEFMPRRAWHGYLRRMSPTLHCTSCDESLGRTARGRVSVDRPFEECPRCRVVVARPGAGEWDLLAPPRRLEWIAERLAPPLVLGAAPGLALLAWQPDDGGAREGWFERPLVVLAIGLVLGLVAGWTRVQGRIRRSRARMNDPMYRARLVAFERRALATDPR